MNIQTSFSQNFNAVACLILELLSPPPHPPPKKKQAMKVSFYKTWTDNWKNNKLLGNTFEHSDKPQSKFQCRSLFRFWVIKLPTEPKKSVKVSFYKKWTNNWKNTKLSENTLEHLDNPQSNLQCPSLFHFWVIKSPTQPKKSVKVSFYETWTNNWKNTKLLGNIYEHSHKPLTNFKCGSLFPSIHWLEMLKLWIKPNLTFI